MCTNAAVIKHSEALCSWNTDTALELNRAFELVDFGPNLEGLRTPSGSDVVLKTALGL